MEKSEDAFEIEVADDRLAERLIIRPQDTTDGIPVYHCHLQDGTSISELRQEPTGEWIQIWGDLSAGSVTKIGAAIAHHLAK